MLQSDVETRIETWIRKQFSISPADLRFGRDSDLFDNGYVDSIGLVELLGFLEEEFRVEISDDLLLSDEFVTIQGIAHAVCQLRSGLTVQSDSKRGWQENRSV